MCFVVSRVTGGPQSIIVAHPNRRGAAFRCPYHRARLSTRRVFRHAPRISSDSGFSCGSLPARRSHRTHNVNKRGTILGASPPWQEKNVGLDLRSQKTLDPACRMQRPSVAGSGIARLYGPSQGSCHTTNPFSAPARCIRSVLGGC
jgi:hypothetical protein